MIPLIDIPSPDRLGYASNPVLPDFWNLTFVMDYDQTTVLSLDGSYGDVSPWFQIDLGDTYGIYAVRPSSLKQYRSQERESFSGYPLRFSERLAWTAWYAISSGTCFQGSPGPLA